MIDRGRHSVLGILVNAVDYEAAIRDIISAARSRQPLAVSALAVHGVMTGHEDSAHKYRLNHLDMVLPDGQPVRWALNLLHGTGLTDRVCGPDLMLLLCAEAAKQGLPIYLYGSTAEVLQRLSLNLCTRLPGLKIAGMEPSKFRLLSASEQEEVVARVKTSGAAMVFVGLGCPRQEVWVFENREGLSMPALAVGAAFDFHAGLLDRPPSWMSRRGLEWLYRLIQEPRRLWRRYLILNPLYLSLLALQALGLRHFDPQDASPPQQSIRYG